jgi:hypothetical protein
MSTASIAAFMGRAIGIGEGAPAHTPIGTERPAEVVPGRLTFFVEGFGNKVAGGRAFTWMARERALTLYR